MRFCLSRLETARSIHSKWELYQRTMSATLDIWPALLKDLSILNTGMG